MAKQSAPLPAMNLEELFASARAVGDVSNMASLTLHFMLQGEETGYGTLTVSRNPTATRWMTTVGIAQGERLHARIAQGQTAHEALDKIERYCYWWLGV